jgi:hypothetical protein
MHREVAQPVAPYKKPREASMFDYLRNQEIIEYVLGYIMF